MHQAHPFWRALTLVMVYALLMFMLGTPMLMDQWSLTQLDRPLLIFSAAAVFGALIASVPERIRCWHELKQVLSWKGCLLSFVAGVLLALGFAIAGAGELALIGGAMQGGLGAMTFVSISWTAAFVTVRVAGRWLE